MSLWLRDWRKGRLGTGAGPIYAIDGIAVVVCGIVALIAIVVAILCGVL